MNIDKNLSMQWKKLFENSEEAKLEIASAGNKPMDQKQLAESIEAEFGDKWRTVVKTAWIKVIEKAIPGKTYTTVTRDEDAGEWEETKNVAKEGQFLIQNAYGDGDSREPDDKKDPSKWLLAEDKIKKNYKVDRNVEVGKCYPPIPNPRKGLELRTDKTFTFVASWGQPMNAKDGDWLVKAGEGDIYRVDKVVFDNTYEVK